jgi:two-component system LytT family response regulator
MNVDGKIRALIVDDEPLARRRIRRLLRDHPDIEAVGESPDGRSALAAFNELSPDLIFLDVQMPELDAFSFLEALDPERLPFLIFVTAYDQYALKAFEFYALDYLLKPFDRRRFNKALTRARSRIRTERAVDANLRAVALLEEIRARSNYLERLVVKSGGRVFFLKTDEIDWIEAEGKYVRLHVGKESYLLREAIGALETQLDPKRLARIHRSTIVNIDRISRLDPWFHNDYRVILRDGTQLTMSRTCRKRLGEVLGSSL